MSRPLSHKKAGILLLTCRLKKYSAMQNGGREQQFTRLTGAAGRKREKEDEEEDD